MMNQIIDWLKPRKIGTRLMVSNGLILFIFILLLIKVFNQVQAVAYNQQRFTQIDVKTLLRVQELARDIEGAGSALILIFNKNAENRKSEYAAIDIRKNRIEESIRTLQHDLRDPEQILNLKSVVEKHETFRSAYYDMFDDVELEGIDAAKKLFLSKVEPARKALLEETSQLSNREEERIQQRQRQVQEELYGLQVQIVVLSLIAVIIAFILAYVTRRSVVNPLARLQQSAIQIAEGNYESKIPPIKTFEIGLVGNALNTMSDAIAARENEIEHLAYYDPLTHLPNRTLLFKQVAEKSLSSCAAILMDIARLKAINETLGFATGDTIIIETAQRIQYALQGWQEAAHFLAKFSGGQFAIICGTQDPLQLQDLVRRIEQQLSTPIKCEQHPIDINLVYGIALRTDDKQDLNNLIRNAEVALHNAKLNTQLMTWYSDAQEASRLSHLSLLSDLRAAVTRSELQMWLQPKVRLNDMHTYGFEALVRWQHPTRGFISPAEFVPFAERAGFIGALTAWMLESAVKTLSTWRDTHPNLSIAVNVSTNDLRDLQFPDRVRELLRQYQVSPDNLKIEITESGIMQDANSTIPLLQRLRDTGVGLSIDDFGTGHSSLAYLQKLPVTELKIDRSFVIDIHQHPAGQRLVKTVIEMGHGLNLSVIAEGIEIAEERDVLRNLGCDAMQGYFASKPLHGTGLQEWLANRL